MLKKFTGEFSYRISTLRFTFGRGRPKKTPTIA
jgi:hypothetical protein